MTLNEIPNENFLLRQYVYQSSNNATPGSNLSVSYGDSNTRMSVNILGNTMNLVLNGSTLASCNFTPVYNSNTFLAIKQRLDLTRVYYNNNQIINLTSGGSNLNFQGGYGYYSWNASNALTLSNNVSVINPMTTSIMTFSNPIEVLASANFATMWASNLTATTISSCNLTGMSNYLYGLSNTPTFTNINVSNISASNYFFNPLSNAYMNGSSNSIQFQIGNTSSDSFNINKVGGVTMFNLQSGTTPVLTFNGTMGATTHTEGGVALSNKYLLSNMGSNFALQSQLSNYQVYSYSNGSNNAQIGTASNGIQYGQTSAQGSAVGFLLNGLTSGAISAALSIGMNGISVNGTSIMDLSSGALGAIQNAATSTAINFATSTMSGIKSIISPAGRSFLSTTGVGAAEKMSLLADVGVFGNFSVHIDGSNNVISITQSNGQSNFYTGLDKMYHLSNVGIGTTSPAFSLDVNGMINTYSNLTASGSISCSNSIVANSNITANMITATSNITANGTLRAYRLNCGYYNVPDYTLYATAYSNDCFVY